MKKSNTQMSTCNGYSTSVTRLIDGGYFRLPLQCLSLQCRKLEESQQQAEVTLTTRPTVTRSAALA